MRRILPVLMLLTLPLAAQEQKAEAAPKPAPQPQQQQVFILKYADPENLKQLLSVFGGGFVPNAEMHALAVTAPPSMMQAIEQAIARLDVPSAAPKNFDFKVELVVGGEGENAAPASVPKDLDGVVAQLKTAFPFKNYRLLDTLTLRTRAGKRVSTQSSGGVVQIGSAPHSVDSEFTIASASLGADEKTIHLDGFKCQIRYPYVEQNRAQTQQLTLQTDLDIKEGQKVVVGRMGMDGQQALFVVVTVKVAQ